MLAALVGSCVCHTSPEQVPKRSRLLLPPGGQLFGRPHGAVELLDAHLPSAVLVLDMRNIDAISGAAPRAPRPAPAAQRKPSKRSGETRLALSFRTFFKEEEHVYIYIHVCIYIYICIYRVAAIRGPKLELRLNSRSPCPTAIYTANWS